MWIFFMIPNNNSWNSRSTGPVKDNYLWWNNAVFVDIQSGIRIAHKLVKFRFTESFCWHRTSWTIIYLISSGIQLYMAITSCNSFNEMLPSRFWSETMMIAGNRKSLARVIWIWWFKVVGPETKTVYRQSSWFRSLKQIDNVVACYVAEMTAEYVDAMTLHIARVMGFL